MREFTMRPEILDLEPYKPGMSIEQIREKSGLSTIIKLGSNENPLGTSPLVQKAIERHAANAFRYPQNHAPGLAAAISKNIGIPEEHIVVGNGSDEVIDMLIRMKCQPGKSNILCYKHSFSMYKLTARVCGIEYREVERNEEYQLPLDKLAEAADENTALVFITSPDNPTGIAASVEDISVLAGVLPEDCLLVVDEAYIDFVWPPESYTPVQAFDKFSNLVVLRTFSKAYGLAGLRLGYGVMPANVAGYLKRARIPFSVNSLAQEAGIAALEDEEFYHKTLEVVLRGREFLTEELSKLGCEVVPSQANFLMFKPPIPVQRLFKKLLKHGIIVRPLTSFGLAKHIRVTVGTDEENKQFIKILSEILVDE